MIKIGLIVNHSTRAAELDICKICDYIANKGGSCHRLKVREEGGKLMENFTDMSELPDDAACVMVFGGDGTIIQAARELANQNIPILGVNLGTVGFLAEIELDEIKQTIDTKTDSYNAGVKEEDKMSDQVRKYAKGETVFTKDGKRLTLEKMTPKQLKQFEDLLNNLENNGASEFGDYLDQKFGK